VRGELVVRARDAIEEAIDNAGSSFADVRGRALSRAIPIIAAQTAAQRESSRRRSRRNLQSIDLDDLIKLRLRSHAEETGHDVATDPSIVDEPRLVKQPHHADARRIMRIAELTGTIVGLAHETLLAFFKNCDPPSMR